MLDLIKVLGSYLGLFVSGTMFAVLGSTVAQMLHALLEEFEMFPLFHSH